MNKPHKSIIVETVEIVIALVLVAIIVVLGIKVYETNFNTENVFSNTELTTTKDLSNYRHFSFASVGDFAKTPNTSLVLSSIAQSQANFTLALGDLGYGGPNTEQAWCDLVTANVGAGYPFELIVGNHDTAGPKEGADIAKYRQCLPNQIDSLMGDYATEYFFDYDDMARFIMISPDIDTYGFDYQKGSEHYNWVSDVIDEARDNNIKWIVLGMHKNCITIGTKNCEIGEDLLNLAVEKKVDLVLQGHEHAYFRSKQLAHSTGCPAVLANTYIPECVANSDGEFAKGAGTVIVITGTGGIDLRDANLNDSEIGYFEGINGANVGNSYGYSLFEVDSSKINASFISVTGEFKDSFVIKN